MFKRIEILPYERPVYKQGYYLNVELGYGNHGFNLFKTNTEEIVEDELSGSKEHYWGVKVSDAIKLAKLWNKYFPNGVEYGSGVGDHAWNEVDLIEYYKFSKKDARDFCHFIEGEKTYWFFDNIGDMHHGIVDIYITYNDKDGYKHKTKIH